MRLHIQDLRLYVSSVLNFYDSIINIFYPLNKMYIFAVDRIFQAIPRVSGVEIIAFHTRDTLQVLTMAFRKRLNCIEYKLYFLLSSWYNHL